MMSSNNKLSQPGVIDPDTASLEERVPHSRLISHSANHELQKRVEILTGMFTSSTQFSFSLKPHD